MFTIKIPNENNQNDTYMVFDKDEWHGIIAVGQGLSQYFPSHIDVNYSNGGKGLYIILRNNQPILMGEKEYNESQNFDTAFKINYPFGTQLTEEEFNELTALHNCQISYQERNNQPKQKVLTYASKVNADNFY